MGGVRVRMRGAAGSRAAAGACAMAAAVALACVLAVGGAHPAFAADEPTVSYDGAADALAVDGSSQAGQDLFPAFKGLMPGDERTQRIHLELANVAGPTRVYVQARLGTAGDEALSRALAEVSLAARTPEGEQSGQPGSVFAEKTLVYAAQSAGSADLELELSVPASLGNEVAGKEAHVLWEIVVEEEDGSGDSNVVEPMALDLVAYEGGLGTGSVAGQAAADGSSANALPEPAWANIGVDSEVTVDGRSWDVASQGMPFSWRYVDAKDAAVTSGAEAGVYRIAVEPLAGDPAVTVDGKALALPSGGLAAGPDGAVATVRVREVSDTDAAESLSTDILRPVYGQDSPLAAATASVLSALGLSQAFADEGSAVDGSFTAHGTLGGECANDSGAHAHVAAGTAFLRNANPGLPANDGARIGLLYDEFLPEAASSAERMAAVDGKALAACGSRFDGREVRCERAYLDLVDMNDGNVWVSAADGSATTVFVPFAEGMSADSDIAVVQLEGLERDWSVRGAGGDLDAAIAASEARVLPVTKVEGGFLFDVPSADFGSFEFLWADGSGDGGAPGSAPANPAGHLTKTGDVLPVAALAVAGAGALVAALAAFRRRSARQRG